MKPLLVGATVTLLTLAVAPAAGQPASTDVVSARLAEDLKGIRQALDRLVVLHETDHHNWHVDLMFKRIELREHRLEPVERRLRAAESSRDRLQESLDSLEKMREQHEQRLKNEIKDGVDLPRSETRRMLDDIKRSRDSQLDRLKTTHARVQQLEDEVLSGQDEIEILEEQLTELLELSTR